MSDESPAVNIVIANFNGRHLLKECLDSLKGLDYPEDKIVITLVDNGSGDGSVDFVKECYPGVIVIKNSANNYCSACNIGVKHTSSELVALLNNDTRVDSGWLRELVKVITRDDAICAVGSKVLFKDGKINSVGHKELPNHYWVDRGFMEEDVGQYDKIAEIDSVSGTACLYKRKYLEEAGLFDEDFRMFIEDVDISIRLKKRGGKIFYCPDSVVYHKFHGSVGEDAVSFYCERNRLLLIAKHYPHRLPAALLGRGYFIALNNKDVLIKVLPEVFNKLIKYNDQETVASVLPAIFEDLNKVLTLEKDIQITDLKDRVAAGLVLLSERNREVSDLRNVRNEISEIYNSQTYKFIARPAWLIINFFKMIRDIFKSIKIFRLRNNNPCLSFFCADSSIAQYKAPNRYVLKIANDSEVNQIVNSKIRIEKNGFVYAGFTQKLVIPPHVPFEVKIDYDWQKAAVLRVGGEIFRPENCQSDIFYSSGFYSLSAVLFNHADTEIDKLTIFQELAL